LPHAATASRAAVAAAATFRNRGMTKPFIP
jgi:hypothetical protein